MRNCPKCSGPLRLEGNCGTCPACGFNTCFNGSAQQ